ncbi:MAG: MBL fold metallo-hydrolase [Acidiferrobacterales bacterium]
MRLRLLGTGTPTPSLRRMSSGYLVEAGDDVMLFDHGPGAYHRMMEAGIEATQITHIFFSHLHYDHCLDYARLVLTRWDQGAGKIPELKVYGPPHTRRMNDLLIGEEGVFHPDLEARTRHALSVAIYQARGGVPPRKRPMPEIRELKSGDVIDGGGWRVTASSVRHVQPYLHCYGYRLDTEAGAFAYSGDSGPCKAMEELAQDCDVLVHMCHYISGTQLGREFAESCMGHLELAELARRANVRNLVVSHVTEQMDVPGIRERLIREMSEIFRGNLFFGEDLMEIPLQAPRSSDLR